MDLLSLLVSTVLADLFLQIRDTGADERELQERSGTIRLLEVVVIVEEGVAEEPVVVDRLFVLPLD